MLRDKVKQVINNSDSLKLVELEGNDLDLFLKVLKEEYNKLYGDK